MGDEVGVVHGTVVVTVDVDLPPADVFRAYADPVVRSQWFRLPGPLDDQYHELDLRVGGHEVLRGAIAVTEVPEEIEVRAIFLDVVADQRIVYAHELTVDGRRVSTSLVTIELAATDGGTSVTHTEQYALLDPEDATAAVAERRGGLRLQLNGLRPALGA
jgi:uncharacterized protein YndB with AHSA1/START domain